ncbi:hypothetical protein [Flagellimonas sp. CMM7]|uniref:hypothetical protein n=1 Tax=Flagellimonas sp. CMM7 TaxID=2654676 RepID=UPI0013D47825|nr:hypothetical protein [Flagellimonas sp. CMM7]UII81067.1 hypothetical protein LV704_06015 [Flagellimonas sp. CMM7]
MYSPLTRISLVILSIVLGAYLFSQSNYLDASLSIVAGTLIIYGYYKYGTVYAAFQKLKKGKFESAEKLINKTKNPARLSKQQKGYYHFVKGMIATENEDFENGHLELTEALKVGLRTDNDTSIVILNLALIEFELKRFLKAKVFLDKLEGVELKPLVKSEKEKLTEKINSELHSNSKE